MKSPFKILIVFFIVAALAVGIYFGINSYKKKKLAEGLTEFAKSKGVIVDEEALRKNLNKLSNKEINALIKFATAVKEKRFGAVIAQLGAITPILTKINYMAVLDKIS